MRAMGSTGTEGSFSSAAGVPVKGRPSGRSDGGSGVVRRWRRAAAACALFGVLAAGMLWYLRSPHATPAMRGQRLAQRLGCFGCHGPSGTGGVPNPRAAEGEIPSWDGGAAMMYVMEEGEIREWILYGAPRRHSHKGHAAPGKVPALVSMPAYQGRLSESELSDLVTFWKAVAVFEKPESGPPAAGYEAASRLGCFGCHGPGGQGGSSNPGAFKRYIPPWDGDDYSELVKSEDELREWILDGGTERFKKNPVARYFLDRQVIKMPAYREVLNPGDLDALVAYITWLRRSTSPAGGS